MPRNKRETSRQDMEYLLVENVAALATQKVWQRFESALQNLEPQSRVLLLKHLNGTSLDELSAQSGIELATLKTWITQSKQELIRNIKKDIQVKQ